MISLKNYLHQNHTSATANRYLRDIQIYQANHSNHINATYSDIMDYIGALRKKYDNPNTIKTILHSIKKYYNYLVDTQQRQDHPCRYITIKDKRAKAVQLQDLFSASELEQLLSRKERYSALKIKNQALLSLLIYQGLTTGEIVRLCVDDLHVEQAEIHIKSSPKLNSRTLSLKPNQVLMLHRYLHEIRPKLVKNEHSALMVNKLGNPETGEQISYLVSTFKYLFSQRNINPQTIRQSVITNLLKAGNDLRVVQVFAGHKNPSATEKYKQNNVETLKKLINRYHPLG